MARVSIRVTYAQQSVVTKGSAVEDLRVAATDEQRHEWERQLLLQSHDQRVCLRRETSHHTIIISSDAAATATTRRRSEHTSR